MRKKTFDLEIDQLPQDNEIRLAYFNASSRTSAFLRAVAEARDESKVEKARQRYGKTRVRERQKNMAPKKCSARSFQSGAAYILKPMYVCTMPGTPGNYSPCGK